MLLQEMRRQTKATRWPLRRWRSLAHVVTFALFVQACFAQGTMAGQGSWVELCTGDAGSRSVVYLDQEGHDGHLPQASDHCVFSFGGIATLSSHAQVFTFPLGKAPCSSSVSLSKVATRAGFDARAPPVLV